MQIFATVPRRLRRGPVPKSDLPGKADRPSERAPRLQHIQELDGLRGIAAVMVFFHHACFSSVRDGAWPPLIQMLRRVSVYGANGVELFFVLSGFLITSILIGDKEKSTYYAPFYWKRALRIVPVYAVMLLYIVTFVPHTAIAVLCAVLFVANFSWFFHVVPLMPFWTLAIEEQFYLLWPTVVHRQRVQTLTVWAIAVALSSVGFRLLFAYFGHYNYYFTVLHCDGLAWGALLACLYVNRATHERRARRVVWGSLVMAAGVFLLNSFLPMTSAPWVACNTALAMTGVSLLSMGIVGLLIFEAGAWWLGPFRSRTLIFFGLISYAFYMVHLYVIQAFDHRWGVPKAPQAHAYFIRVLVTFAAATAIATASRYLLELPAIRLRRFIPSLRDAPGHNDQRRLQ